MYRLVPISSEEYRALFDAGAWVYGCDLCLVGQEWVLKERSDTRNPKWRSEGWAHCYTRVEQDADQPEQS